jgi:hypothetical protein
MHPGRAGNSAFERLDRSPALFSAPQGVPLVRWSGRAVVADLKLGHYAHEEDARPVG